MTNKEQLPFSEFPRLSLPGWSVHRSIDRPAVGAWPRRRQILLMPAGATSPTTMLRVDLFDAAGAGEMERVVKLLAGEVHAREAQSVALEKLQDGSVRWSWRGVMIVGHDGVVAQVRNAGEDTADLSAAVRSIDDALSKGR